MYKINKNKKSIKNDQINVHSFSIPENIKEKISERGFAIYNWIGPEDLKHSIEKDFLKLIKFLGPFLALLVIIPSLYIGYAYDAKMLYIYLIGIIFFINLILISYLIILSIQRSSILRKNSHIFITDTAAAINGKIKYIKDNKIFSSKNLNKISRIFEEPLFGNSNINKTKETLKKQVLEQIKSHYITILKIGQKGGKNSFQFMLLVGILYSIYAFILLFIYFIGIGFVWILGNFLSFINKQILIITGHKITVINNYFETIDKYSKKIIQEQQMISILLKDAENSNWKDGLLTKINSKLENINSNADKAINNIINLRKYIQNSEYKKIFNFNIYNNWIKKQILTPLNEIKKLLEINLDKLNNFLKNTEKQISETKDEALKGHLKLTTIRLKEKIKEINNNIENINIYINKLK